MRRLWKAALAFLLLGIVKLYPEQQATTYLRAQRARRSWSP
jgi:hypothetical protein